LHALGFLSWLGSITSSAIVYLCRDAAKAVPGAPGATSDFRGWGLLLSILLAEHFYLVVQMGVGFAMGKLESAGLQKERRERYNMKKKVLMETLGQHAERLTQPGAQSVEHGEKLNREALEEEARKQSVRGGPSVTEMWVLFLGGGRRLLGRLLTWCRFWQRQRRMSETVQVGRSLIKEVSAKENGESEWC
jgi:hypothetical protein